MITSPAFVAVFACALACVAAAVVMCITVIAHNGLLARQALCAQAWSHLDAQLEQRRRAGLDLGHLAHRHDDAGGEAITRLRTALASHDRPLQAALHNYNAAVREFEHWQRTLPASLMVRLLGVRIPAPVEAVAVGPAPRGRR